MRNTGISPVHRCTEGFYLRIMKQNFDYSIHVPEKIRDIIERRSAGYPSKNAYFIHCIEMEDANPNAARDAEIARCVTKLSLLLATL